MISVGFYANSRTLGQCSGLQPEGNRTVIDQTHLHIRAEAAALHDSKTRLRLADQVIEQPVTLLRRRGIRETGATALARIRGERELRHQQQSTPGIEQTEIHPALGVGKHPVTQQALEQARRPGLVITPLHADQHQQSRADRADHPAIDPDLGLTHALQQTNHRRPPAGYRPPDGRPAQVIPLCHR